jgi:predicted ATP-grasp superfamily ATP-dependent carboligase
MPSRSRYASPVTIDRASTPEETLEALIKAAKQDGVRPVLIPTGDVDVALMSDNRDVLREYFRFVLSDARILEALLKKDEFYRLAIRMDLPTPKTYFANDLQQVQEVSSQITFPCVIKPRYSPMWQHPQIAKALRYLKVLECSSPEELLLRYGCLDAGAREVVIQEMIPGGEENLHDVYLYLGPGARPMGSFCLQKVRTIPIAGRGGGTLVQSTHNKEIEETGLSFLQAIGYRGPAAVCFKQHARTGEFTTIEVNARLSLHHSLAAHCGIDFAYLLYLDCLDTNEVSPKRDYPAGVKWIAALGDLMSFRDHHKQNGLSFGKWLLSYRGPKTFGDWSWDDPWPFVRECFALLPSFARKVWFRYAGKSSDSDSPPKRGAGALEK